MRRFVQCLWNYVETDARNVALTLKYSKGYTMESEKKNKSGDVRVKLQVLMGEPQHS